MKCLRPLPVLFGLTLVPTAALADGALDPSFWTDGRIWFSGDGRYDTVALLTAPDGRLVVVGSQRPPGGETEWFWRRVGDASYSTACVLPPQGSVSNIYPAAAAFDPQGRLVVAGTYVYPGFDVRPAAARYLYPDCTLDTSFDGNGIWAIQLPQDGELAEIAIAPSGRILLVGNTVAAAGDLDLLAILLHPSGAPVTTFSGDGWTTVDTTGLGLEESARGAAITPSGQVLLAGAAYYGNNLDWSVTALTPAGALDPAFGDGGKVRVGFDLGGDDADILEVIARDPASGRLVLGGSAETVLGRAMAVARLLPDGTLDPSFSSDGLFHHTVGAESSEIVAVAVDGLGRVVGAGSRVPFDGNQDFLAVRLTASGSLDPTFSADGWRPIAFDAGPGDAVDDQGVGLALQSGNYALAGLAQTHDEPLDPRDRVALARLRIDLIFADGFESGDTGLWP